MAREVAKHLRGRDAPGSIVNVASVAGLIASPFQSVYAMTKALWSGLDQLIAAHSAAKSIDPKRALEGMPVPLHPGAERYYKEVGLLK